MYTKCWIRDHVSRIAREAIIDGFDYNDVADLIKANTQLEGDRLIYAEDEFYDKLSKVAYCIKIIDKENGSEYYYKSFREAERDTNIPYQTLKGASYKGSLIRKRFKIERYEYSSSELTKCKKHLFENKIGKIDYVRNRRNVADLPVRVTDTKTGLIKDFKSMKAFADKYKFKFERVRDCEYKNARLERRYKIEVV